MSLVIHARRIEPAARRAMFQALKLDFSLIVAAGAFSRSRFEITLVFRRAWADARAQANAPLAESGLEILGGTAARTAWFLGGVWWDSVA